MYKKTGSEGVVNVDTMKQEKKDEKLTKDDDINPYQKIIVNNKHMDNVKTSQMAHWSILSNVVNYVQYDRDPKNLHDMSLKALDQKKSPENV